jgi:type IV pilus assembly protein PilY1
MRAQSAKFEVKAMNLLSSLRLLKLLLAGATARARALLLSALVAMMVAYPPVTAAGELTLADAPLFLGGVPPNVFFELDDSGSMDYEFMARGYWPSWSYDPDYLRDGSFDSSDAGSFHIGDGKWWAIGNSDASKTKDFTDSDQQLFTYIFDNTDNAYSSGCGKGRRTTEDCGDATFDIDWRGRSAGLNVVYYDPDITYTPWKGAPCADNQGALCLDADFNAVRSDPRQGKTGYTIIRDLADINGDGTDEGLAYDVWIDDRGFTGDRPHRGTNFNATDTPNGQVDLWDGHVGYRVFNDKVQMTLTKVYPRTDITSLTVKRWGQTFLIDQRGLQNVSVTTTLDDSAACYNALGDSSLVKQIFDETLQPDSTGALGCRTIAEIKQNAANWYQYSRRRSFVAKGAIGEVLVRVPNYRYGMSVINGRNNMFVPLPPEGGEGAAYNTQILTALYKFAWQARGTPLRSGLEDVGEYFAGNLSSETDPIIKACQKNFGILFTDGFYDNENGLNVGDQDGDTVDDSLADIAYKYYTEDLSSFPDEVPPDPFDAATWQHMVTMTISFGVEGNLADVYVNNSVSPGPPVTGTAGPDLLPDVQADGTLWSQGGNTPKHDKSQEAVGWGDPVGAGAGSPERVDDLWHAAFNARGQYINAQNPTDLIKALQETLAAIAERLTSASSVALNTGSLNANARTYQARFTSEQWTGQLLSIPISDGSGGSTCTSEPRGQVCPQEWDAAAKLAGQNWDSGRSIFTYDPDTGDGVPFRYDSLAANQQTELQTNPDTGNADTVAVARARLDYLRGDDSNEGVGAATFRPRKGKPLGDIIHSSPVFSGDPMFRYPDGLQSGPRTNPSGTYAETYSDYKSRVSGRTPLVFAGGNDGMVHAFNAEFDANNDPTVNSGKEVMAYVPNSLFPRLNKLTSHSYSHKYYVDGDLTVGDAFFSDDKWHTVLLGTLRAGGQGIFALDITDPSKFTESASNAKDAVLWEFTDADNPNTVHSDSTALVDGDADLGYTFARAAIVRLADGKWAAIFGNGYNNTENDGSQSASGDAVLYVVDLETGELIKKIDTGIGKAQDPTGQNRPNGLATPTPIDRDRDNFVEAVYAGDLFGNLWKFDLSSDDPTNWDIAYGKPLFVAKDGSGGTAEVQPITTRPVIGPHPTDPGGVMVYFGTGKYFEVNDNSNTGTQTQSLYGVWDQGGSSLTSFDRSDLLEQVIFEETTVNGQPVRVTSNEGDDPSNPDKYRIDWSTQRGWYMDLMDQEIAPDNRGERMVTEPLLRNGRIIFITMIPSADPCSFGGDSWLMELDANDGSRLAFSPFDLNADNAFDQQDYVTTTLNGNQVTIPVSGRKSEQGIIKTPGVLYGQGQEFKYASGSAGGIDVTVENPGATATGRQSWQQLK